MPNGEQIPDIDDIEILAPPAEDAQAVKADADERDFLERSRNEELLGKSLNNKFQKAKLRQENQNREERKSYANKLYCLTAAWIAFIGFLTVWNGYRNSLFYMSDKVLIALIGSTTTSVIGIFLIVANYLFPKPKDEAASDAKKRKRR